MTVDWNALAAIAGFPLWSFVLVFVRCAAAMAVLPAFGDSTVPARIKLAMAFALALAAFPLTGLDAADPSTPTAIILPIMAESVSGLVIGLVLRLFVTALQVAGAIAAQSTALSQIFATAGGDPLPAIAHILTWAGFALLMLLGFHVQLVAFVTQSYQLFPVGDFPDAGTLSEWTVDRVSKMFALAFQLAAPFILISVLYNIMLGVINRAMPQLMVAFVGAPLITMGSLVLLFASAPLLLPVWATAVEHFLSNPAGLP